MAKEYQSPAGRHRHLCRECDCVWEHVDDVADFGPAHTCPKCGTTGWIWLYQGPQPPAYKDHHLTGAAAPKE